MVQLSPTEHQEQVAFVQWCQWNAKIYPELTYLFAIPNGGLRMAQVAVKLKSEGVRPGVWDMFLPCARGGYHGLFLEFKSLKGRLSDEQKAFQLILIREGYANAVCYTTDHAITATVLYLKERFNEWEKRDL